MTPILEMRSLSKTFRAGIRQGGRLVHALTDIDLTVEAGESLGIVGESGCGKSTLARCALRLLKPDKGSVLYRGLDLQDLPPQELRTLRSEFQIVFQDSLASLNPRMTVREILAEPFEVHRRGRQEAGARRMTELIAEVGLDESLIHRRPAELSGGQQQRVAIARALALNPRLLIADEPVSALDASVQTQILNLLGQIRQEHGISLVMISHSFPVIRYLCSRIVVMYLGRIVEDAPADEFFRAPGHPYSRALLESMPVMHQKSPAGRPALPGEVPSAAAPPPGCPFHPRCPSVLAGCRMEIPPLRVCGRAKVACFLVDQDGEC